MVHDDDDRGGPFFAVFSAKGKQFFSFQRRFLLLLAKGLPLWSAGRRAV